MAWGTTVYLAMTEMKELALSAYMVKAEVLCLPKNICDVFVFFSLTNVFSFLANAREEIESGLASILYMQDKTREIKCQSYSC